MGSIESDLIEDIVTDKEAICDNCELPAVKGKKYCQECSIDMREGFCATCINKWDGPTKICDECRKKCPICKEPNGGETRTCRKCLAKKNSLRASRKEGTADQKRLMAEDPTLKVCPRCFKLHNTEYVNCFKCRLVSRNAYRRKVGSPAITKEEYLLELENKSPSEGSSEGSPEDTTPPKGRGIPVRGKLVRGKMIRMSNQEIIEDRKFRESEDRKFRESEDYIRKCSRCKSYIREDSYKYKTCEKCRIRDATMAREKKARRREHLQNDPNWPRMVIFYGDPEDLLNLGFHVPEGLKSIKIRITKEGLIPYAEPQ